ncbi:MAG: Gfo/Idh/MocA family oxidoreductase [Ruminococcaceae bacterium]|nr:Gfo/Idh/MocA family oxidoreductase [Oscillospiraceae bacterium]
MIRVGILGSDNSHALAFSKLCNIPNDDGSYNFDDIRITAIYGKDDDPAHTKEVAEQGKIEFIANQLEDFFGKVDAVMVVYRRGSYHVADILPFVAAGMPVWIDKPIAASIEDVKMLKAACERHNTLITGGSTVKYCYDVLTAVNRTNSGFFGNVLGGNLNFPGDTESIYDGIFFYASHAVEIMLTVFGYDIKSVIASKTLSNRISVIAKYDSFQVTLNFVPSPDYMLTVYGDKKSFNVTLDISTIYKLGFEKFAEMLKTGKKPLSFEKMVKPVYVIDAIDKSLKLNKEVTVE